MYNWSIFRSWDLKKLKFLWLCCYRMYAWFRTAISFNKLSYLTSADPTDAACACCILGSAAVKCIICGMTVEENVCCILYEGSEVIDRVWLCLTLALWLRELLSLCIPKITSDGLVTIPDTWMPDFLVALLRSGGGVGWVEECFVWVLVFFSFDRLMQIVQVTSCPF